MTSKFKDSYKTIGEVINILNYNNPKNKSNHPHTLRYWETQFKQIKPKKINNRRYYDRKNIDLILKIQYLLKIQGLTINGVRNILNDKSFKIESNNKKIANSLNIKYRLNKINNLIKNLKNN
tara:strand:+ start:165 stop:530 length:366 start_codon:yes stop_codon:yes gene_type:complete